MRRTVARRPFPAPDRWGASVLGALALALSTASAATASVAEGRPRADLMGRPLPLRDGRPAIELYVNPKSRKRLHQEAFELAWALRESRPRVVVHVDLREVPSLLHGVARGKVRSAWHESLRDMSALFRRHGEEPPAALAESLFMVADMEGAAHAALGISREATTPFARVLDGSGKPLEQGPFPAAAPQLQAALEPTTTAGGAGDAR